jgi:uncharacterized metal-binding protein YceD (DUF177 family)
MFDYRDFDKADIRVEVEITKHGHLIEVGMQSQGTVELPDDRTGHLYRQKVNGDLRFLLKYGAEYNDDDDEMIIIPYNEAFFNMAKPIYEMVVLSVPMKHLDPGFNPPEEEEDPVEREVDPRWAKLRELLNSNNNKK